MQIDGRKREEERKTRKKWSAVIKSVKKTADVCINNVEGLSAGLGLRWLTADNFGQKGRRRVNL